MEELLIIESEKNYEVRQSKINLPPLSQGDVYLNKLIRFNPQLLNTKGWALNAIITGNPTCIVKKDGAGFKVVYKSREYHKRTIEEVVKCIEGIKSVLNNKKIPHKL